MTYAEVAKKLQDSTAGEVPELRVSFDDTTSRFFISTKGMGADQNFTLEFGNDEVWPNNHQHGTATSIIADNATDGAVKFDGIEINGLKTNRTTVNGLILDLTQVGPETTITVQSNPEKPLAMIKDFVEKYNETIANIEKQLIEKRYPRFPTAF